MRTLPLILLALVLAGCARLPKPGTHAPRQGDEIVVAGQFFHTGTPVVLWLDEGGYDAYRVERRFAPFSDSDWNTSHQTNRNLNTPNRYGLRTSVLGEGEIERVRGGGWDLELLTNRVDQFVLHFDACGTSRQCFKVLHDLRCLSVHFMLDLDGTIYQTLDLKERAWHASVANSRSIGIEIANIGAYPPARSEVLNRWYQTNETGQTAITIPANFAPSGIRRLDVELRPDRPEKITGAIQGQELVQYDFTPAQYEALAKLTAALCTIFPNMELDYPRDNSGELIPHKLAEEQLKEYHGLIGHFHVSGNKVDPGPAFQWDKLIEDSRKWMGRKKGKN